VYQVCDAPLIFGIGMNKGEDTDFYLRKGFRVVAIKANHATLGFLVENYPSRGYRLRKRAFGSGQQFAINQGHILAQSTSDMTSMRRSRASWSGKPRFR
jgi:hypothetical protein